MDSTATIAALSLRQRTNLPLDKHSDDWASIQSSALQRCCERPGTLWLACCGSSSPLPPADCGALQLRVDRRGGLTGAWVARRNALALTDSVLHGVVLSHCLEDEQSPLSQLDEALRVLRPGGQLSVWLWGAGGAGQSPGPAIASRALRRLRRWAAARPLQLIEMVSMNRGKQQIDSLDISQLPLLQRWWHQRRAAVLRLDYRYSGSQGIALRHALPLGRRVSVPAQGLSRV